MSGIQGASADGYWFVSKLFAIEPGEDALTQPGRYGRQLATWLADALSQHGYPTARLVAEDWGWCVVCTDSDVRLWVGCGNVDTDHAGPDAEPRPSAPAAPVWHCFVQAEAGLLTRLFKARHVRSLRDALDRKLCDILTSAPAIRLLSEAEIP